MITDSQLIFMVSLKIPYIIMEIIRELKVTSDEAFEIFYSSYTYSLLSSKETYYWGESAQYVADSFFRENKGLTIEEY